MKTAPEQHKALLQVVGEMWHEMHKTHGTHKRLFVEIVELSGSACIRGGISWVDHNQKSRLVLGKLWPFADIPEVLDTTMLFRDIPHD